MTLCKRLLALSVLAALSWPVSSGAGPEPSDDLANIAQRLVAAAGTREGDLVLISGRSRLLNFVPAGMVTLFLGGNQWAGGENSAPFGLPRFLTGTR